MLKLIVEQKLESANLKLKWCVGRQLREKIKDIPPERLFLLLVVIAEKSEMSRHVVPLENLVTVIPLHRRGENKVIARLFNATKDDMWKTFTKKESGCYRTELLDYKGRFSETRSMKAYRLGGAKISVEVPEELFGEKLGKKETWVLGRYCKIRAGNECHNRKARLVGYPLFFLLFPLELVFKFFARTLAWIVLTLLGYKLSVVPLFTPWTTGIARIQEWHYHPLRHAPLMFKITHEGENYFYTTLYKFAFTPGVIILAGIISIIIKEVMSLYSTYTLIWIFAGIFGLSLVSLVVVDLFVAFFSFLIIKDKFAPLGKFVRGMVLGFKRILEKAEEEERERLLEYLSCDMGGSLRLKDLPKKARSISLRYLYFKGSICRPLEK